MKINRGFYYDNIPSCFNPIGQSIEFLLKLWLYKLYQNKNLDFMLCSYSTKYAKHYLRSSCWLSYFLNNRIWYELFEWIIYLGADLQQGK